MSRLFLGLVVLVGLSGITYAETAPDHAGDGTAPATRTESTPAGRSGLSNDACYLGRPNAATATQSQGGAGGNASLGSALFTQKCMGCHLETKKGPQTPPDKATILAALNGSMPPKDAPEKFKMSEDEIASVKAWASGN